MKALIVDDSRLARKMLKSIIAPFFNEVFTSPSGEEGLRYFHHINPELAILDITLPGMNGLQLLSQIKTLNEDCRILMVSANSNQSIWEKAFQLGADSFIQKPFNANDIILAVKSIYGLEDTPLVKPQYAL